jgi:lysophospholipase L1-like esterase
MKTKTVILSILAATSLPITAQEAKPAGVTLPVNARVAIVGDSITEQKLYSKYMECYLLACTGRKDITCFQYGWSGERADGFSARLENDLPGFAPNVVTLCYGMNDGSYQPFNDDIGGKYEGNMRSVLEKLRKMGINQILVGSPGAVDTKFFGQRPPFGDKNAAESYNDNLSQLGGIGRKLAGEFKLGFADVHHTMVSAMKKAKPALGEDYDVCGRDGFHPGPNGHLLMAEAFLSNMGLSGEIGRITVSFKDGKATVTAGHTVTASSGDGKKASVDISSTTWPFCFEGDAKSSNGTRSITAFTRFNDTLNRMTLLLSDAPAAKYKVTWGTASREFTKEQLTAGINLAAEFDSTPFDAPFGKFRDLVAQKQNWETVMIKQIVTNFRNLREEVQTDAELAEALATLTKKLVEKQQKRDAAAKAALVAVPHQIIIESL